MDWEPRVGMRVVCVDATARPGRRWADDAPSQGTIYTISDVFIDVDDDLVIGLLELPRSAVAHALFGGKAGYLPRRFRPLDERRIDIFRSVLTQAPTEKEPA